MFSKSRSEDQDGNRISLSEALPPQSRSSVGGDGVTAVQDNASGQSVMVKPNASQLQQVESSNPEADAALDML